MRPKRRPSLLKSMVRTERKKALMTSLVGFFSLVSDIRRAWIFKRVAIARNMQEAGFRKWFRYFISKGSVAPFLGYAAMGWALCGLMSALRRSRALIDLGCQLLHGKLFSFRFMDDFWNKSWLVGKSWVCVGNLGHSWGWIRCAAFFEVGFQTRSVA